MARQSPFRPHAPAPADAAAPWKDDLAFRSVVAASGDASLLHDLVRQLALTLDVAYAFVAEFAGAPTRVRTVGMWGRGAWLADVEYDLAGTPCEEVAQGSLCHYRDGVAERFPLDAPLVDMGARGYLGVPLVGADGNVLGHLAVIDTKPIEADGPTTTMVQLFADRARIELERLRADVVLERASRDLEVRLEETEGALRLAREQVTALFRIQRAVAGHLERRTLFAAVAEALRGVLPAARVILFVDGDDPAALDVYAAYGDTGVQFFAGEKIPRTRTAAGWVAEHGAAIVSTTDDVRERFPVSYARLRQEGMDSIVVLPLMTHGRCVGALTMMGASADAWDHVPRALLDEMAASVAVALDNCLAHEEVARLRDRLAAENVYLQEEILEEHDFREVVGRSPAMLAMLARIETVAPTDATVLVLGETGTGKELVARAIHDRSRRRDRPLVKLNCAVLSAGLVESELFGHVKGAFTGALADRVGRFELADGGTIFLDEIGELAPETQAKLLRVMQEREFEPVGSSKTRTVDTRIIAATNRNLEDAVAEGKFRADLFYRLNVIPIHVPALRDRPGDVRLLVHQSVARYARELGKPLDGVSRETMERLEAYGWPGNVRELQNVIERAVVLASGPTLHIEAEQLPMASAAQARAPAAPEAAARSDPTPGRVARGETLEASQRRHIEAALATCGWVIEGERGAAAALALHPNTLRSRMKKLGIRRPTG